MNRLVLMAMLFVLVGCSQQKPEDQLATVGWTTEQFKNYHTQVVKPALAEKVDAKALKDGTVDLNVKSIKTKSAEADEVVINHGGKFELRSGARFVRDGKEEDSSKPPPKPDSAKEDALRKELELLRDELKKLKVKKEEPSLKEITASLADAYLSRLKKIGAEKQDLIESSKDLKKIYEGIQELIPPKPHMPPAKNGGFPGGGSPPEAKAATGKAWPLGDNVPAALIPIEERRLWKTEEDYQTVLAAIAGKWAEFYEAPMRIQWPYLANPYSPTVYL